MAGRPVPQGAVDFPACIGAGESRAFLGVRSCSRELDRTGNQIARQAPCPFGSGQCPGLVAGPRPAPSALVDLLEPYWDTVFPDLVTSCYSPRRVVKDRVENVGKMLMCRRQPIRRVLKQTSHGRPGRLAPRCRVRVEAVVRVNDVKSYFDVTLQSLERQRFSCVIARKPLGRGAAFSGDRRLPTKQPGGEASVIGAPR